MDVSRMAHRPSFYERAIKEQARQKAAMTLECPQCGAKNQPGNRCIDIDDKDDAWCGQCSFCWQVQV